MICNRWIFLSVFVLRLETYALKRSSCISGWEGAMTFDRIGDHHRCHFQTASFFFWSLELVRSLARSRCSCRDGWRIPLFCFFAFCLEEPAFLKFQLVLVLVLLAGASIDIIIIIIII